MGPFFSGLSLGTVHALSESRTWLAIGFAGQALFGARFVVQWIVSEFKKESTVPLAFWFLSLLGGATLLSYAIYRKDPVFIFGQAGGLLIYCRNLVLIFRNGGPHEPGGHRK